MANGISMAASVSEKISRATCFRSGTFEGAGAGLGYVHILIFGAVTDADGADADALHL